MRSSSPTSPMHPLAPPLLVVHLPPANPGINRQRPDGKWTPETGRPHGLQQLIGSQARCWASGPLQIKAPMSPAGTFSSSPISTTKPLTAAAAKPWSSGSPSNGRHSPASGEGGEGGGGKGAAFDASLISLRKEPDPIAVGGASGSTSSTGPRLLGVGRSFSRQEGVTNSSPPRAGGSVSVTSDLPHQQCGVSSDGGDPPRIHLEPYGLRVQQQAMRPHSKSEAEGAERFEERGISVSTSMSKSGSQCHCGPRHQSYRSNACAAAAQPHFFTARMQRNSQTRYLPMSDVLSPPLILSASPMLSRGSCPSVALAPKSSGISPGRIKDNMPLDQPRTGTADIKFIPDPTSEVTGSPMSDAAALPANSNGMDDRDGCPQQNMCSTTYDARYDPSPAMPALNSTGLSLAVGMMENSTSPRGSPRYGTSKSASHGVVASYGEGLQRDGPPRLRVQIPSPFAGGLTLQ